MNVRSADRMSGIARRFGAGQLAGQAPRPVGRAGVSAASGLRRGHTGGQVRELQRALLALGYLSAQDLASGPGVFGPRTEQAVKAFQVQNGIKPSGVVGSLTRASLASRTEELSSRGLLSRFGG